MLKQPLKRLKKYFNFLFKSSKNVKEDSDPMQKLRDLVKVEQTKRKLTKKEKMRIGTFKGNLRKIEEHKRKITASYANRYDTRQDFP